ncbi:NADP-dependent oxidoreductase [Corynebacterium otitidis]|uniref:Putative NADP-dependent oxidoreductase n=1 Tax=Corynebacterium otitidis ATCC 51513 TaxID=883169 RepID=I7LB86_9CORY|nr:NADP-dependent oxidoreductase [Corynebacterium otitidis]EJZ82654.1 hypothetical protein HMPREF9719_00422 [Corynebacterium otitidis ATCC 51513]CCI82884.1 putative NADP-dependent oxidoreductase [Corynebacterium otitidis ATCC 51513]
MSAATSTEIRLVSRPEGWPSSENVEQAEVELPELDDGEVRVKNTFISVDPYMRGRMSDAPSYIPPFELGKVMAGGAVGRVVESRSSDFSEGDLVQSQYGWRTVAQGPAGDFTKLPDNDDIPESAYLGILGMTSLTAMTGLVKIAEIQEGDVVFISGAAGAVGSAAGQFAKLLGAKRVIGSAGSDEKVRRAEEKYGYDKVLNYKKAPIREQLLEAVPEGIDVYYDNVGSDHLEAAIEVFNDFGRAALCGVIATLNSAKKNPGPDNMGELVKKSLRLQGFTVGRYPDYQPIAREQITEWFTDGKLNYDETVVDGIENALDAFINMMRGENTGKMVVRIR